ncbi:hypothetical protein F183_A48520 [Bryobacterales bacterium F-183]|nr:hypothetical protein F183_A48520 [Bryobacterales bacterium F-183]
MELFCGHVAIAQTKEKTTRWTLVREGLVSVYTDAGPQVAIRTLERVRTMAELFREFGRPAVERPVRIVVFRSSAEFEQYRPSRISVGFFQSGAEGDWIVFPASATDRVLLHEFTHLLLHRTTATLPQWLEEGLAEFFSTTRIINGYAEFGLPIPEHQRNLQFLGYLRASDLTAVRKNGIHYEEPELANRFYATSWMLVHMLYSAPRYSANMPGFVQALDDLPSAAALPDLFRSSFGVTLDDALDEARKRASSVNLGGGPQRRIEVGTLDLAPVPAPSPVSPTDLATLQAELFLDRGLPDQAARKYDEVVRIAPSAVVRDTALGYAALASNSPNEALARFGAAVKGGTTDARTVLEYAMLLRDSQGPASRDTVTQLLEKAVNLDPNYAEVLFLLGVRASDRQEYSKAILLLQKAVAVLPRQSAFWHALAYAQAKTGASDEARRSANRALRAAENLEQEEMAKALLQMEGFRNPDTSRQPARRSATEIGSGWQNPKGDATAAGLLESLDCSATPGPRLLVRTSSGIESFSIQDPQNIQMEGAGTTSMEWTCGKITPQRVQVEYLRSSRKLIVLRFLH